MLFIFLAILFYYFFWKTSKKKEEGNKMQYFFSVFEKETERYILVFMIL